MRRAKRKKQQQMPSNNQVNYEKTVSHEKACFVSSYTQLHIVRTTSTKQYACTNNTVWEWAEYIYAVAPVAIADAIFVNGILFTIVFAWIHLLYNAHRTHRGQQFITLYFLFVFRLMMEISFHTKNNHLLTTKQSTAKHTHTQIRLHWK